jgi:hypothetical protein
VFRETFVEMGTLFGVITRMQLVDSSTTKAMRSTTSVEGSSRRSTGRSVREHASE